MLYDINKITIEEVIIYLRKSQSDDPSMTVEEVLAKHESNLQDWAIENFGEKIPESQIYREVVSGETIADRPVMQTVLKLMELPSTKAVLAVEPQRFSRGDLEDCGRIVNAFRYTNTYAITLQQVYNLAEEYDRKFFEMELTRGSDYLEYYKKIQRRGRETSAKKGNFIGSIPPYGYNKVAYEEGKTKCHTLEINPVEADAIRMMIDLYLTKGYGFKRIADALDEFGYKPRKSDRWSPAAIKDIIENPVINGKIRWNYRRTIKKMKDGEIIKSRPNASEGYIYVDGKHEAIIDEETFRKVIERRGKNPRVRKSKDLTNPYAGLLFCGKCGRAMSHKKYKPKRSNTNTISQSMICNNQSRCKTKSVQYFAFENRVIESIEKTIADFELKLENNDLEAANLHMNLIKNLEAELKALKEKDARQKDNLDDGIYTKSEFLQRNGKVQEQLEKVREALCNAKNSTPPEIDYQEKIVRFKDCLKALQDPDVPAPEKNLLLKACIEKIVYHNNMPSIAGIGKHVENIFELDIFLRL